MKTFSAKLLFVGIYLGISMCSAQLPRQIKPKIRGFPKKGHNDPVIGRNVMEAMYRLNNTFIPSRYQLEIRVILDKDEIAGPQFTAPGSVRIFGVNQEQTSKIVLHANQLFINESSVVVMPRANRGEKLDISGFSKDDARDFFIIELAKQRSPGEEYEIYIEFEATIIKDERGLFYRTYKTENEETKIVAATQLQSVDARRLFPCFDEPDLKATFELSLIRKSGFSSVSNTKLISSTPDPKYKGWVVDKFAPTVRMSTYLLAFSVSDYYSYVEGNFGKNRPSRIYGPKHLIQNGAGNHSVNVAAKCLSFYEEYFNESYKLSKMDSVAIPWYSGAMENWGMNVYGFSFLLHFPGKDREARRNLQTLIVAHELAHQWFGNLVTAKWWNELFLNEGISTYVQYLGMDAACPEFRGLEFAILDAVQFSMLYDAGQSTHPMTLNVSTPDEIDGMFSTITYEKGASIFRMLEGILTKETLKKGLQMYLKRMAFKGAEQDDLYDSLQLAAMQDDIKLPPGLTVHEIMHSWTEQAGFPLVKVDVLNKTHLNISQQRFANDGLSDLEGLWHVPITIVTKSKPKLLNNMPQVWLKDDGESLIIKHNWTGNDWIMINQNATGFYRVLYDEPLHQLIQAQLENDESLISPLSRSQLLDDYFVFAAEKYVNIQTTLNLTRYLHKERHFAVWSTFLDHFSNIYEKFSSHPAYPLLKSYLLPKLDRAIVSIGLEETPEHRGALAILRADLLDWSCSLESPLCREYAGKLFAQWQANPSSVPITSTDSLETLQCAIVAVGGKPAFEFMFQKYEEVKNDTRERRNFLNALSCATDELLVNELLTKTLNTTSGLLPSDATLLFTKVATNPFGRIIILNFLSENIDSVIEGIGNGQAGPIAEVLNTLATYYSTEVQLNQVQRFLDDHEEKLEPIHSSAKAATAQIKENLAWMDATGSDVWQWLWYQTQYKNVI